MKPTGETTCLAEKFRGTQPPNIFIYQIFYNEYTRQHLDVGFIPLDNTENLRPDWFEFWVIRNFLLRNQLDPNGWYGFLSPSFGQKTSLAASEVIKFVASCQQDYDVAILPHSWDEIAYFLNPFEQGELVHRGISGLSSRVFSDLGFERGIEDLVNYSGNFTFSNYIVAKPVYWSKWLAMADAFFWMAEEPASPFRAELVETTKYRSSKNIAQFKVFIQERFPALILSDNSMRTLTYDVSSTSPIRERFFSQGVYARGLLQTCDLLKKEYCEGRNDKALGLYLELRKFIKVDLA